MSIQSQPKIPPQSLQSPHSLLPESLQSLSVVASRVPLRVSVRYTPLLSNLSGTVSASPIHHHVSIPLCLFPPSLTRSRHASLCHPSHKPLLTLTNPCAAARLCSYVSDFRDRGLPLALRSSCAPPSRPARPSARDPSRASSRLVGRAPGRRGAPLTRPPVTCGRPVAAAGHGRADTPAAGLTRL